MALSVVGLDTEAAFYQRQVAGRGGPILVLGCGNGRLSCALAERGHEVVAVDPSERMVSAAVELKARWAPNASVDFQVCDLRAVRLQRTFPFVFAPQNAVGLMQGVEGLAALWQTVRLHLERDGTFAFDLVHAPGHGGERRGRAQLFVPHLRVRGTEGGRPLQLHRHSPEVLDGSLRAQGLLALERFGDFRGRPFDDGDTRQVVVGGWGDDAPVSPTP